MTESEKAFFFVIFNFLKSSIDKTWTVLGKLTKNILFLTMQIHETIFLAKKIKKRTKMSDLLNFTYLYKVSSKVQEIIRSGFKTPRIGSYSIKNIDISDF